LIGALGSVVAAALTVIVGLPLPLGAEAQQHRAIAYVEMSARGFDDKEFACLDALWTHESLWNMHARGPTKDFGIPQAHAPVHDLPAEFYTDPLVQIRWGIDYIESRYGTPCQAWRVWRSRATRLTVGKWHGGWY
jgi:hypothetical protein